MKRDDGALDITSRVKRRRRAPSDPLDSVNAKSDADFIHDHFKPGTGWDSWEHPKTQASYTISLKQAEALSAEEFDACFDLIERTSGDDYRASAAGWRPLDKRAEMKSKELRYVLVKNAEGSLRGFTSLMPTWEDGKPVVYCYEIHLEDELHGTGLAAQLMDVLVSVAENTPPIEKVMLTCYLSNKRARAFYAKLGFTRDPSSPKEKRLRNRSVYVPDFEFLSRPVRRGSPKVGSPNGNGDTSGDRRIGD